MGKIEFNEDRSKQIRNELHNHFNKQKNKICSLNLENENIKHIEILPHIGDRFDLRINGKARRILFVGLEGRHDDDERDVYKRTQQIKMEGCLSRFHKSKSDHVHWDRNEHMNGITLATTLMLGKDFSSGHTYEDEIIQNHHLFNYIALSNWYQCGHFRNKEAIRHGKDQDKIAVNHFIEVVKIIEPTIVIMTGNIWFGRAFGYLNKGKQYIWDDVTNEDIIFKCRSKDFSFPIIRFCHPAAHADQWHNPANKYYQEIVKPTINHTIKNIL